MQKNHTDVDPAVSVVFRRAASEQDKKTDSAAGEAAKRKPVDAGGDLAAEGAKEEAAKRQRQIAGGDLAERVRRTFPATGAEAEGATGADVDANAADADADADAEARHGRAAERDGEKPTPILVSLARLRAKSERARGPAPSLWPVPSVGKPPPGRGLVGGGKIKERPKPAAPKSAGRGGPAPRF